jgi:hypothetical protein
VAADAEDPVAVAAVSVDDGKCADPFWSATARAAEDERDPFAVG